MCIRTGLLVDPRKPLFPVLKLYSTFIQLYTNYSVTLCLILVPLVSISDAMHIIIYIGIGLQYCFEILVRGLIVGCYSRRLLPIASLPLADFNGSLDKTQLFKMLNDRKFQFFHDVQQLIMVGEKAQRFLHMQTHVQDHIILRKNGKHKK